MERARDKQHGGETNTGATHQNPLVFFVDGLEKQNPRDMILRPAR
jgi:hypothetical protein